MAATGTLKVRLEGADVLRRFEQTRIVMCRATNCRYQGRNMEVIGYPFECSLKTTAIGRDGVCSQFEIAANEQG